MRGLMFCWVSGVEGSPVISEQQGLVTTLPFVSIGVLETLTAGPDFCSQLSPNLVMSHVRGVRLMVQHKGPQWRANKAPASPKAVSSI